MEYICYCDESSSYGEKYSDFFGGCIVRADRLHQIEQALNNKKTELNLHGEVKWTKITEPYKEKYCELIRMFFQFIQTGDIKVRIMFRKTENQYSPEIDPLKMNAISNSITSLLSMRSGLRRTKRLQGSITFISYWTNCPINPLLLVHSRIIFAACPMSSRRRTLD